MIKNIFFIFSLLSYFSCFICFIGCTARKHPAPVISLKAPAKQVNTQFVKYKHNNLQYSHNQHNKYNQSHALSKKSLPRVYNYKSSETAKIPPIHSKQASFTQIQTVQTKPIHSPTVHLKTNPKANFIWPHKGPILRNFKQANLKGIEIKGQLGMPVKAAAGGIVVYSGNGLKGYGNLIIIKHDENFLSAYAHNDKLMVKEGERVTLGQKIANLGKTGTDCVKLHFEIRYKGKPIDPLQLLPKG